MLNVVNMNEEEAPIVPAKTYSTSTGDRVNRSEVRYEIVRMLLDNMSYMEIRTNLKHIFKIECAEETIMAFKKNYLPIYKDMIEKWDMSRHQYLVNRISDEMKMATKKMVQEIHELDTLMAIVDDRIKKCRSDPEKQTAAYEGVLKDYIRTKALFAQRVSAITGSTGVEEKLKEMVHMTAMAAQKTLHPYIGADRKDEVYKLFDQEIESILLSIESGAALSGK